MFWRQIRLVVIFTVIAMGCENGAKAEKSQKEDCQNAVDSPTPSSEVPEAARAGSIQTTKQTAPDQLTETAGEKRSAVGDENLTALPFRYVGNKFSSKFHRPSCPFAKAIASGHLVFFDHRHNAVNQGFQPCRYCLPPDWKTVHAVILPTVKPAANAEVSKNED